MGARGTLSAYVQYVQPRIRWRISSHQRFWSSAEMWPLKDENPALVWFLSFRRASTDAADSIFTTATVDPRQRTRLIDKVWPHVTLPGTTPTNDGPRTLD